MFERNNNFITEFTQVFSRNFGWVEVTNFKENEKLLVFDEQLNISWLRPILIDSYKYEGLLTIIDTDSETNYLKPSTQIIINESAKSSKDIHKGDLITRKSQWQYTNTITKKPWKGKMYRFFFGEDMYMPISFGNDYCILVV